MVDVIALSFLVIVASILVTSFIAYPLWIALHHILSRKLDSLLFKEPYFARKELTNYLCWPLSYVKSANYIGLVAAPRIAKRKRFKGLDSDLPLDKTTIILCKVELGAMLVGAVLFITLLLFMAITIWIV